MGSDPAVREALWGGPGFSQNATYYQHIAQIARIRRESPALRYGRFYFRPISGDGQNFGISPFLNGVLAFSRILMDEEVLVVANTDTNNAFTVYVIVDITLNGPGTQLRVSYTNKQQPRAPSTVHQLGAGTVTVREADGTTGAGPVNCVQVKLVPLEVQILARADLSGGVLSSYAAPELLMKSHGNSLSLSESSKVVATGREFLVETERRLRRGGT